MICEHEYVSMRPLPIIEVGKKGSTRTIKPTIYAIKGSERCFL